MGKKTIPAEDRIAQFFKMFFDQHQEKILSMRYAYEANGRFPEEVDKLDPDHRQERHTWQPNTVLYWEWRRALENFAIEMRMQGHPLDLIRALTAIERRAGVGRAGAVKWMKDQDFPRYFKDWCTSG